MRSWREIQLAYQNKSILVTGSAGFLGSHLCQELLTAGANVTGIDQRSKKWVENSPTSLSDDLVLPIKIQNDEFNSLISNSAFDVVFHLAGLAYAAQSVIMPYRDFKSNLFATVRLIEVLRQNNFQSRLVYTSSAAVYGQPDKFPIDESTETIPISPYGVSKLSAEHYIRVYSNLYGFQALIARPFSLYGPRQRKQVVYDIIRKSLQGNEEIELLGDGTEVRDFLYVEDAVRALLYLGAIRSSNSCIFNICSGQGVSIQELAQSIFNILGKNIRQISFSGEQRPGDPLIWLGSNDLLLSTGFKSKFNLDQGLELTIQWYQHHF